MANYSSPHAPSRASGKAQSAICLIVKNENPEIAEWIAHYINIGADRLIIYDDGSTDGTRELLEKLGERFPITVIDWKTDNPRRQFAAYQDCMDRFGDDFEWMGFFDADEFVIPPPGKKLSDLFESHKDHDAFAFNWLIYGSNAVSDLNGHSVMETFTERAENEFTTNLHVKGFVRKYNARGELNARSVTNPHIWEGPQYYDVGGRNRIEWSDTLGITTPSSFVLDAWRLHHYATRSQKIIDRRGARGAQHVNGENTDNAAFIRRHDRNDVHDTTAVMYGKLARQRLIDEGFENLFSDVKPLEYLPSRTTNVPVARQAQQNLRVFVDEVRGATVHGWAENKDSNLEKPVRLRFLVDGEFQDLATCNLYRLDVDKAGHDGNAGYHFVLPDSVLDGSRHILTVETLGGDPVTLIHKGRHSAELNFTSADIPTAHHYYERLYSGRQTSAVCLIVKDENPDIAEWVAHYTNLGFNQIIIYDNGSKDGTRELLDRLAEKFPIKVVDWVRPHAQSWQMEAYRDCLERFGPSFDKIAFFDADEFLIPPPGFTLTDLLERHRRNDAVWINWLVYGTSQIDDLNGNPIMTALISRAEAEFSENQNGKLLVNPAAITNPANPHYFYGPQYMDVAGEPMKWSTPGVSYPEGVKLDDWVVVHYVLRTLKHWLARVARGAPRRGGKSKATPEFFVHHDRNEVYDDRAIGFGEKAKHTLIERGFGDLYDKAGAVKYASDSQMASYRGTPTVAPSAVTVILDSMADSRATGWIQGERLEQDKPIELKFFIDGVERGIIVGNVFRQDVANAGHDGRSGFNSALPREFFDGENHELSLETIDGQKALIVFRNSPPSFVHPFNDRWIPSITGNVDGFKGDRLSGWALWSDVNSVWVGGLPLVITCEGEIIGRCIADVRRPDVARVLLADPKCGFDFQIPPQFRHLEPREFRVQVEGYDVDLVGSPFRHGFAEQLQRTSGKSGDEYTLSDYNSWNFLYSAALTQRIAIADQGDERGSVDLKAPTISVVCPVYRPDLNELNAAIASVMSQTYQNWELILVNDGSRKPAITSSLMAFAKADARIRVITSRRNNHIAEATNIATREARGEYVVLFDHDDLLSPVALQVMLKEARRTGALFLYSDEDKIDHTGRFSDPALKPDFNLRLLRGVNYICHLSMIHRETLLSVGPFSTEHNGAQDHDIFLKLAETISADRIHHVPEILYHWRKTAGSTAAGVSEAKPYAIEAGRKAVQDHLGRQGLPARVSPIGEMTFFQIDWEYTEEPKVCIIIPFRDGIPMTQKCVDLVLDKTIYSNYEIILVDNGSVTEEAKQFCEKIEKDPRVRVLRIDEPFNFSMLNNRAAEQTNADFLVLMNNDLHIRGGMWLRKMVNEALADEQVAIVGGKWLYPDGTVQHAGTIIGPGGVAAHIAHLKDEHEAGYMARAILSQEMSAVTAACMLVRKTVWEEVGGLTEDLAVAFNDMDLCCKVRSLGYKIIQAQHVVAWHLESVSRGSDEGSERFMSEVGFMKDRWGPWLENDPHYSRFFDLRSGTPFYVLGDPIMPREYPATYRLTPVPT